MRFVGAGVGILLVVVYALGSGYWVSTSMEWYQELTKPVWQPPNPVFGLAWTYNFIMLAVVSVVLALRGTGAAVTGFLIFFAISIVFALAWAYLFYVPHSLLLSAVCLALAAIATVPMVVLAWSQVTWLGIVLLPYQLWLVIATSLSWGYWALND